MLLTLDESGHVLVGGTLQGRASLLVSERVVDARVAEQKGNCGSSQRQVQKGEVPPDSAAAETDQRNVPASGRPISLATWRAVAVVPGATGTLGLGTFGDLRTSSMMGTGVDQHSLMQRARRGAMSVGNNASGAKRGDSQLPSDIGGDASEATVASHRSSTSPSSVDGRSVPRVIPVHTRGDLDGHPKDTSGRGFLWRVLEFIEERLDIGWVAGTKRRQELNVVQRRGCRGWHRSDRCGQGRAAC